MIWRSSRNSNIAKIADFFTVIVALLLSVEIWKGLYSQYSKTFPHPFLVDETFLIWSAVLGGLYVFILNKQRAYHYQRFTSLSVEIKLILKTTIYSAFIFLIAIFLLKMYDVPRTIFLLSFVIIVLFMLIQKTAMFFVASYFREKGFDRKRVLLIGTGTRAMEFMTTVEKSFSWGLDIIGLLTGDAERLGNKINGYPVIGLYSDIMSILKEYNPEEVIVTISTKRFDQIRSILELCEIEGVKIRLYSDFFGKIIKNVHVDTVFGMSMITFSTVHISDFQATIKRIVDLIGGSLALLVFSPFMIAAAIGILITDGWPVLYRLNVVGLNKKPFYTWKFRTMVRGADKLKQNLMQHNEMEGPVFKIKNDPRIIPFGRWLRKFSIDETPQLFSVLLGDLSLVGPRAAGPHELAEYESWHRRKLSVKPGLTCIWQVYGRNTINKFDDWVKLDLEYIDNYSLILDFKILLKTIPTVFFGRGAS